MAAGREIDHASPMHQFLIGRLGDWQVGGIDDNDFWFAGESFPHAKT